MNRTIAVVGHTLLCVLSLQATAHASIDDLQAMLLPQEEVCKERAPLVSSVENESFMRESFVSSPGEPLGEVEESPVKLGENDSTEEIDSLETLLTLVQDVDIQTPEVETPSFFMVGVRTYGIAFLYKCYDFQRWAISGFKG
ncbi:hypothetical protein H0X06_02450 [Candidatus Dependentiae bacterium]|nr:hypothetical protein [Candidatus Dependentiae bacterium]